MTLIRGEITTSMGVRGHPQSLSNMAEPKTSSSTSTKILVSAMKRTTSSPGSLGKGQEEASEAGASLLVDLEAWEDYQTFPTHSSLEASAPSPPSTAAASAGIGPQARPSKRKLQSCTYIFIQQRSERDYYKDHHHQCRWIPRGHRNQQLGRQAHREEVLHPVFGQRLYAETHSQGAFLYVRMTYLIHLPLVFPLLFYSILPSNTSYCHTVILLLPDTGCARTEEAP